MVLMRLALLFLMVSCYSEIVVVAVHRTRESVGYRGANRRLMYLQGMTVPLLDDPTVGDAANTDMTDIVWVIVFTCINLFIVCHTDIVRVMNDRMAECHYGYIALSVGHIE